jgi:hypothetical protein
MAATYNCTDASNSAYGAGGYGTCGETVGAPNTGVFGALVDDGSWMIIAPLVLGIMFITIAAVLKVRRKKQTKA